MRENMGMFRGKDENTGEWVFGNLTVHQSEYFYISYYQPEYSHPEVPWMHVHPVDPSTVGECTGISDKKGTMIYEGDVLGIEQWKDEMGHHYLPARKCATNVAVKWGECSWVWESLGKNKYTMQFPEAWGYYRCEVIGNVFDNPELLGEE